MRPLLEELALDVFVVGDRPGQGQTAKLINNLMSATAIAITAEAVVARRQGRPRPRDAARRRRREQRLQQRGGRQVPKQVLTRRFDQGFRLALMAKDVHLCLGEAERRNVPMLLGGTVDQLWAPGGRRAADGDDCTAIVRMFEEWAGATIAGAER